MTRFPFSQYPRGWYRIAFSSELKPQQRLEVRYFALNLALVRDRGGHIAIDGERVPQVTALREQDGIVYAHWDSAGKAPSFELPAIKEFCEEEYGNKHHLRWRFRSHVQELAENGVDYAHFAVLHQFKQTPVEDSLIVDNDHLRFSSTTTRRIFGLMSSSHMLAKFFGLGFAETSLTTNHVRIVTRLTPTPVEDEIVDVDLTIVFKQSKNPIMNWMSPVIIMPQIKQEFERDIMVWERKIYRSKPGLCAGDGPIMKVRKWAERFYEVAP